MGSAGGDASLPFTELLSEPDEPGSGAGGALGMPWRARDAGVGRGGSLRGTIADQLQQVQQQVVALLHTLTFGTCPFLMESVSLRNGLYLGMSALVFACNWTTADMNSATWALGLLYIVAAVSRTCALEPLWTALSVLVAQCVFDASPAKAHAPLWYAILALGVASEVCWWPSAMYLMDHDTDSWVANFSMYYALVVVFWFWPLLLGLDIDNWEIVKEIGDAPDETREAFVDASAGLAVMILIPLGACTVMMLYLLWRRSPRHCAGMVAIYLSLALLLVLCRNADVRQLITGGQVLIAALFLVLSRQHLVEVLGDHASWHAQVAVMVGLLCVRDLAWWRLPPEAFTQAQAVAWLVLQLLGKLSLAARCSAVRLGLPSMSLPAAWAPRRSGWLLGRPEVHDAELQLGR